MNNLLNNWAFGGSIGQRTGPGPFKTYGKQPFTPEVAPQVLKAGHLVYLHDSGMSSLMHDTTLPPQF
jgi:hypothetical protein